MVLPLPRARGKLARWLVFQLVRRGYRARLWERPPPRLHLSGAARALLQRVAGEATAWDEPPRTPADELLLYLLLEQAPELAAEPAAAASPLARLACPDRFPDAPPDFAPLFAEPIIVEALQDDLARRWAGAAGGAALLEAFLDAADRARRRDLAGFVLEAAARRRAPALVPALRRWRAWHQEHLRVRFFDDGYPEAQKLIARYQRAGPAVLPRSLEELS